MSVAAANRDGRLNAARRQGDADPGAPLVAATTGVDGGRQAGRTTEGENPTADTNASPATRREVKPASTILPPPTPPPTRPHPPRSPPPPFTSVYLTCKRAAATDHSHTPLHPPSTLHPPRPLYSSTPPLLPHSPPSHPSPLPSALAPQLPEAGGTSRLGDRRQNQRP